MPVEIAAMIFAFLTVTVVGLLIVTVPITRRLGRVLEEWMEMRREGAPERGVIDDLVGVQVKPALPARARRPGVPSHAVRLQTSARQLQQILLQRLDAKRVRNSEILQVAVGPVRVDPELTVADKEAARHVVIDELSVVEIP